ncbi:unnamed protein product [Phytophthora lilii]|uniref:Unnamed protein product n=1 Tax=Phytophthora lilii TaxID=2077276 RepID=A0A9W6YLA6_9STRA|nr:unnamed protein product [Phytophthora lilii]
MTETVVRDVEDFLTSCDLSAFELPNLSNGCDDSTTELSISDSTKDHPPHEPKKRGRKKSTIDPVIKLELDRIKDRKRCSRYRARQRDERQSLKQQVKTLTAELAERKKAQETSRQLSTSAWKMLAQSELEARLNSEEQQRLLYEAVEARAAFIREFQKALRTQLKTNGGAELEEESSRQKRSRLDPCDAAFYEVFVDDLDAIYAQTDDTLRACGLGAANDDHVKPKQLWREDGGTGCFMYIDKHVMPLNFQQTCEMFWQAGKLPFRQEDRQDFESVNDPDNTAAFKFRVSNRLSTGRVVSALVRFVTRRYQEENRVVVVWQSLMEGEGIFTGMRAGETGWDVLTPSTATPNSGSVVKTCICHTPMHLSTVSSHDPAVKQFTGMMLGSVADDGTEIAKMFEKLLIDEN